MKPTGLSSIQARMLPGAITLPGFLGSDRRPLADILAADDAAVRKLGLAHERIADRLAEIARQGRDAQEREIEVEGRYRVSVRTDRGLLPSPFGDGAFEKGETELVEIATGRSFRWTELSLHLLRTHGFYGGQGSAYRLEPAELAEALGLRKEKTLG
jgi:hypothetical protein